MTKEPRCVLCMRERPDSVQPATVVHHIKPREKYPQLTYDPTNVVGLCSWHHGSIERQIRDGRTVDFGRNETTTGEGYISV